jgi:hypothetical protein
MFNLVNDDVYTADPAVNNAYSDFLFQVQAYHRVRDKPVQQFPVEISS